MTFRIIVILSCAALTLVSSAVASAAATPVITDTEIPLHSLGVDPMLYDACGFEVEVLNEGRIRTIEYSDGSAQRHSHQTFLWQANGLTLREPVNFSIMLAQDGSRTYRGTVFNLHVPGVGPAIVEAGIAEFGPDGGVVRIAGLHQVLEGPANVEAVCSYFAGA